MSLGLALQQLAASAAPIREPRKRAPVKMGYCHRCVTDNKQLRFARWGAGGAPIYNRYCTDCHKVYCREARKRNKISTTKE